MSQVRKDVLNGWKEIAAYLGRDPRTVERWEKQRRLPVRRVPGGGRASVYALVAELDAWLAKPLEDSEERRPLPRALDSEVLPPERRTENTLDGGEPSGSESPRLQISDNQSRRYEEQSPACFQDQPSLVRGKNGKGWYAGVALAFGIVLLIAVGIAWHRRNSRLPAIGAAGPTRTRPLMPLSKVPGVEDLYLRACYNAELRTPESLERAEASFTQAISKDPGYAPAYSGLASTFLLLREYSLLSEREAYTRASVAADRALQLDPELPEAHAAKGFVEFFWKWDQASAVRDFEDAEHLQPRLALAHHWYGSMLTHEGRYSEALQELQIAQNLEPGSPAILTLRAFALGLSGHRPEALDLLEEAVREERPGVFRWPSTMHHVKASLSLLAPRDVPQYLSESLIAAQLRNDPEEVKALRKATVVYSARGDAAMWRSLLESERKRHGDGQSTYATARYKAVLGQKDAALLDLRSLYAEHDPSLIGMSIDPLLSSLHRDTRFRELRRLMGLPDLD